jgi:hypothetical protein
MPTDLSRFGRRTPCLRSPEKDAILRRTLLLLKYAPDFCHYIPRYWRVAALHVPSNAMVYSAAIRAMTISVAVIDITTISVHCPIVAGEESFSLVHW